MPTIWWVASVPALQASLLLAAVQLRHERGARRDIQRADTFRAA